MVNSVYMTKVKQYITFTCYSTATFDVQLMTLQSHGTSIARITPFFSMYISLDVGGQSATIRRQPNVIVTCTAMLMGTSC